MKASLPCIWFTSESTRADTLPSQPTISNANSLTIKLFKNHLQAVLANKQDN